VEPESETVIAVRDMRDIVFLERWPAVVGA
jgi:hypothetical protein